MNQPDLLPRPSHAVLVVPGADLAHTIQRLQDQGVVITGYSVKLSTYRLNLIVPYGVDTSTAATVGCACDICQLPHVD